MNINKFIDFKGLFLHLVNDPQSGAKTLPGKLGYFITTGGPENFELVNDECEITDTHIHFSFGKYSVVSTEASYKYVASCNYYITYDRGIKRFVVCEYEEG